MVCEPLVNWRQSVPDDHPDKRTSDPDDPMSRKSEVKSPSRSQPVRVDAGKPTPTATVTDVAPGDVTTDVFGAQTELAPSLEEVGKFKITDLLGRGGFGEVLLAHDDDLRRDVAIKVPNPNRFTRAEDEANYLAEAQLLASLSHPGIVPVFEAARIPDGGCYVVSEYIEGPSLAERIENEPIPAVEAARLIAEVAEALDYAHKQGVVHRDIKPGNILLKKTDHSERPVLIDFGIAFRATGVAEESRVVGTVPYMSPEQARGEMVCPRSDQFSLGIVFYELLTGERPFKGADRLEVLKNILRTEAPPPREVKQDIPVELSRICMRALEKQKENRYASAQELADELRFYLKAYTGSFAKTESTESGEEFEASQSAEDSAHERAALLLADLTRKWRHDSAPHHLPSLWNAIWIHLLTDRKNWTETQRVMMQTALKRDRNRLLWFAFSVVLGWFLFVSFANYRVDGLVDSLRSTEWRSMPQLVEELSAYGARSNARLRNGLMDDGLKPDERLRFLLALSKREREQLATIAKGALLAKRPDVIEAVCRFTRGESDFLEKSFWSTLSSAGANNSQRFRAACALATFDPGNADWNGREDDIVRWLVSENPSLVEEWSKLLRPIAPRLRSGLKDTLRNDLEKPRRLAALRSFRQLYRPDAKEFTELIETASPDQLAILSAFAQESGGPIEPTIWNRLDSLKLPSDAPQIQLDQASRARANLLVVLRELGSPNEFWNQLQNDADNRTRYFLIDRIGPETVSPELILEHINLETNASTVYALLLSLGDYPLEDFTEETQALALAELRHIHAEHSDSGVHSAAELVLKRWGEEPEKIIRTNRGWHVNEEGHTLAVLEGPFEFLMGAPPEENPNWTNDPLHWVKIPRTFGIATKEVTQAQFLRFQPNHGFDGSYSPDPDCPMTTVGFDAAMRYCNWLSAQEGISENQMCYAEVGTSGMKPAPDYLDRVGYRLPTEAEWEFACRAGSQTPRFYGFSTNALSKYCWYIKNANGRTWPVGLLRPNRFGLFDTYGNVFEWVQDNNAEYPDDRDGPVIDEGLFEFAGPQIVRGGSFAMNPSANRSAQRIPTHIKGITQSYGFRVARTIRTF